MHAPTARRAALAAALFAVTLGLGLYGNVHSIDPWDEATYVRVVEEMMQRGRYTTTVLRDQPYYSKPPLKLWLTVPLVRAFGDGNRVYRLIDALAGAGTVVVIFLVALRLGAPPWQGALAALFFVSAPVLWGDHGFRSAVHDSLLVLLSTAAMLVGMPLALDAAALPPGERRARSLAVGLLSGAAVLTKWLSGLWAPAVIGTSLVLSGRSRPPWATTAASLAAIGLVALALPLAYVVPQLLLHEEAFRSMVGVELVRRVTTGMHHGDAPLYYWSTFWSAKLYVPALPLALGVAAHATREGPRARYLLLWAFLPTLVHSLLPARLPWYLLPALPAAALLAAEGVAASMRLARDGGDRRLRAVGAVLLVAIAVDLGLWLRPRGWAPLEALRQRPHVLTVEKLVRLLRARLERDPSATIGFYRFDPDRTPSLSANRSDRLYLLKLRPRRVMLGRRREVAAASPAMVLTTPGHADDLAAFLPPLERVDVCLSGSRGPGQVPGVLFIYRPEHRFSRRERRTVRCRRDSRPEPPWPHEAFEVDEPER